MSWTSWFRHRPLLQAEVDAASEDDRRRSQMPGPSAPLSFSPLQTAAVPTEAPAVHVGGSFELEVYAGRAAEIEASAEIVEEALAVAHTVYSESCDAMASSSNTVAVASASSSSVCVDAGIARRDLHSALQEPSGQLPAVNAGVSCQALVPSSVSEGPDLDLFSCVLDLGALRAPGLRESLGPGIPSVEELLACGQPHDILGVPKDASSEEIKKAFHRRARAFHPDKHRDDDRDVDRAFNQAFMLITRAYMTLIGTDGNTDRLQILNKMDLRRDRPVVGWALQQKYDEKKRERLTRAEKTLTDAKKEVTLAQQAYQPQDGQEATSKESRVQQRRLTRAKLALSKAEATVQAEEEYYQIQQQKDREKVMQRLEKEERAKESRNVPKSSPKKRQREIGKRQQLPEDIIEEAARLEEQAEEMRKRAASLRAKAHQDPSDEASPRGGKRRLVIK